MSRLEATFASLRGRGRTALVPYVTAGDPTKEGTADILAALAEGGADVIELGIPFSDPMADGPVIQKASERALARGTGLVDVLAAVSRFRERDDRTPIVLMGYANPIERHGVERFADAAHAAGVDGILVVDYPPEECADFAALLRSRGIDLIFLIAPTSTDARIAAVGRLASGYVYHVALKGVTGAGHFDIAPVAQMIPRIRKHMNLPIGVGFGIRDGATAKAVASFADAVIIGTALVQALEGASAVDAPAIARGFVADIRAALDTRERNTA